MRIYFARHGESQANILHEISNRGLRHPLTPRGREQAALLADQLQGSPIIPIYSSPLLRALETAVILAGRLSLDYEVVDALREFDCGIAEGRSDAEAWKLWQGAADAWTTEMDYEQRIRGGESFHDIQNRFVPFIEGLVREYGSTPAQILCVGHGGLYWMMLPLVIGNVSYYLLKRYGIELTSCIVAEYRSEGLYCVEWNGRLVKEGPAAL
jgi:broad specificity phosphatase PhoE